MFLNNTHLLKRATMIGALSLGRRSPPAAYSTHCRYFEYALIAVNLVTGYMEQHEFHRPAHDIHALCKSTFEERNINSMNVAMSHMNIGVMCCRCGCSDAQPSRAFSCSRFAG